LGSQRQKIVRVFRALGLLGVVEKIHYLRVVAKYERQNKAFRLANPEFKVPPQFLAFDAYSAPDWDFYKKSGQETAVFLSTIADRFVPAGSSRRILEWGCGPARVIRHIPEAFGATAEVYGSDYNPQTIKWCTESIPEITFVENGLRPPLPFAADFFDFVYSISVFTHLSEAVSHEWMAELSRITHPGSVLVITTNGDSFVSKLLPDEIQSYKDQGIVIRGQVTEGTRIFSSCHSPAYVREKLFKGFEVLEFTPAGFPHTGQDMWVIRKP
jgi:SAM-dependent methyltransferase